MSEPNRVFVQAGPSDALTPAPGSGNRWTAAGIDVEWTPAGEVVVSAVGGVSRVALRWDEAVPAEALVLGDAWERSYGDLQWRPGQPERLLPWYWLAHDRQTGTTTGMGVDVHPGAFCSWTVDHAAGW